MRISLSIPLACPLSDLHLKVAALPQSYGTSDCNLGSDCWIWGAGQGGCLICVPSRGRKSSPAMSPPLE